MAVVRPLMSLSFASIVALTVSSGDASAAVVGPDASGYLATDQAEFPPGSLYNYVDIQLTGVVVAMGANGAGSIPLGAPFVVYGAPLLEMVATSHGILTDDLGAANDVTNDCPLPDPPSVGRGFRIYPLHDVPVTTVFYQYFTEAEAAALGFPMQPAGVSVFQWVGGQNPLEAVDFEVVLFHSDDSFLMMVAEDANSGSSSTVGIQNAASTLGLTYQCNTAGGVIPATTAVLYTAGNPPDSDCCSPSATNTPGCTNPLCQEAVCAADSSCCGTEWDASCGALAATQCPVICGGPPPLSINEIRISQPGADDDEYVEIAGPPGTGLTDLQYVVIGDFPTGEVETVVDLTGSVIPPSGSFLMAEPTFSLGPIPDLTTSLNLENLDTVTHLLVGGMTASVGDNLDVDADGILDFIPWSIAFDTVVFIHPSSSDLPYGPGSSCMAGPNCQQVDDGISSPSHAFRCPDATGVWQNGDANQLPAFTTDSPGSPNPCTGEICGNGVVGMGEDCDDMGESAACDANCTFATCGDGVTNMAAGEACDDAGESAMCNADCSAAMCGDGIVNTSAAEDCDGNGMGVGGETAMCDVDCTTVMCGDGVVNPTAGETCDDGGRSDMCDADCTTVDCGDGLINISAGEQCDGDGMGMGGETATCDGDCTDAMCGDGVINTTAGEDCDDMGESVSCDDDCTAVECGDGTHNTNAGEQCDDGNTEDGDGCSADCSRESDPTTGGADSTGAGDSTGGADSTGDGSSTRGGQQSTSSGPGPATTTVGSSGDDGTRGGSDDDGGGAVSSDDGCRCISAGRRSGSSAWSLFGLLGLVSLRRRRRMPAGHAIGSRSTRRNRALGAP